VLRSGAEGRAMTGVAISPAEPSDLEVVEALLQRQHLPILGLREQEQHMVVARDGRRIVGCASIEVYGRAALLRSVAVDAEYQGKGVGGDLTGAVLELAARHNVSIVYLLTETAERFFPRFGFEMIDRADVPAGVRQSAEFAHGCCPSAHVMRKFVTSPT
jgi:amino-acid N-acetyltransferase